MITELVVLKESANVDEVTVTAWMKAEGDEIVKGEPLVELTTDKACVEIEAPASGILRKIFADEKSVVPIGFILALIGDVSDSLPDVETRNRELLNRHRQIVKRRAQTAPKQEHGIMPDGKERIRATPAARRFARKHSLDLAEVQRTLHTDVITEAVLRSYNDNSNV
ncbi:MAG: hypothetical protein JXN60_04230 [Lentisphaerae bacterium]|nr:hypothetical protein [Lentisphaerota bacterium]